MASIAQQPNKFNAAYAPNVWVLSGLGGADRFVLSVIINGQSVATYRQPSNGAGVAIIDISKVLQSYLEPTFVEDTQYAADTPGAFLSYQVQYGTQTGNNSPDYDGTSATKYVINAYDNWRTLNADYTDFLPNPTSIICETPGSNVNAVYAQPFKFLTNYPEDYVVRPDEYKTLSFFSRLSDLATGPNWGPNEAPFFVVFTYFLAGVQVAQGAFSLVNFRGSSLRTNCQDLTVSFTDDNSITTIGVGPQNQADAGISGNWDSYRVDVMSYNHCDVNPITNCASVGEMLLKADQVIYTANFTIDTNCEKFTPITVSFLNQYGVKDYYTFRKRNTRQVSTQRQQYTKALGTWNSSLYTIDAHERGDTVYSGIAETEMTLSTDWMSDSVSEWMRELYMSPSVMIYVDGQWEPAVITTSTYEEKTYARQQLFQHEITVKYANNQKIQRG